MRNAFGLTWRMVIAAAFWLLSGQTASAHFAVVPRHFTVVAGVGGNFGGADTAFSAGARGLGQFYDGQGQYLWGAGQYLRGLGQYEQDHQVSFSMAVRNYYNKFAMRREWNQLLEYDRQVRLAAMREKNESLRSAKQYQTVKRDSEPQIRPSERVAAVEPKAETTRSAEAYRKWLPSPLCRTIVE